ncbi:MAG: (2Fe-2S)-binding protein [Desulfotomaculaceae bacterium]|nr:(2Fe-2S)-binding protein [Desulfotomaculaceae bacterium]
MSSFVVDKDGNKRYAVTVNVNGSDYTKVVKANTLLVNFLREELDLIGTKRGCELGDCGCCTVMLDGKAVNACIVLALDCDGREVTTVEGIQDGEDLDIVQEKFIEHAAFQCGFCTPGMIVSSRALLNENTNPSEYEVREAIAGNLCRCTGYVNIVAAVLDAAENL